MSATDLSRRRFLLAAAGTSAALCTGSSHAEDSPRTRPPVRRAKPNKKIAVVTTAYHYLSHAYHVCGRFLYGYLRDGKMHFPDFAIAGMHVEQTPKNDLSRALSQKFGFPLYSDVASALN